MKKLHTFKDHSAAVYSISAGSEEHTLFSASGDRFVVEWDIHSFGFAGFTVKLEHPAYSVRYIVEYGFVLIGTSAGGLHVVDRKSKRELRHFAVHTHGIYDLLYDVRQDFLYVAGGDGVLTIWRVRDWQLMRTLVLSEEKLRQLALSNDGSRLAIACKDGRIIMVETMFFNTVYEWAAHTEGTGAVAFHPLRSVLMSGGKDAYLKAWDARSLIFQQVLSLPAHNFAIYAMAFSEDSRQMATASRDKTWKLWDASALDVIQRFDAKVGGHTHSVNKVIRLSNRWITCGDDRQIMVWGE